MGKITRRAFLGGGAALLLGAYIWMSREKYADWYARNLKNAEGESFVWRSSLKPYAPSQEEISTLEKQLETGFRAKVPILGSKYSKGLEVAALHVDNALFAAYEEHSKKSIADFLDYVGISNVPSVTFDRLGKDSSFSLSQNVVKMLVAWRICDSIVADYTIELNGSQHIATTTYGSFKPAGEVHRIKTLILQNDGFHFTAEELKPVLVSVGLDAVSCYTTPPAEVLHHISRDVTYKNSTEEINEAWIEQGEQDHYTTDMVMPIFYKWMQREEAVVHGLLDSFVTERGPSLGFSRSEIESYMTHGNDPRYCFAPNIMRKVSEIGPKELMRKYLSNSKELFAE